MEFAYDFEEFKSQGFQNWAKVCKKWLFDAYDKSHVKYKVHVTLKSTQN